MPIGVAVGGANRNDHLLLRETIESVPVARPRPTRRRRQGLCLDKGYDYAVVYDLVIEFAFTPHVRARGEEAQGAKRRAGARARRWVVERTHSWLNRFRGLLVRWAKKPENYLAQLHLAFAYITFHCSGLLG